MDVLQQDVVERTKEGFDFNAILTARTRTWEAIEEMKRQIRVGMTEEEGTQIADAILAKQGAEKRWHRSYVRFGKNTLLPYGKLSEKGVVLEENGIYFLDIGPVWNGYEGDAGITIVTGNDPDMHRCVADSKRVFDIVREEWLAKGTSGVELYRFASRTAESLGWTLDPNECNGHRLSEFPHALHYKGAIADLDFSPAPGKWVLEIHLRHPRRPFGAFYEDLLM